MSSPQTSHVQVCWRSVSLHQRLNISFRVPECRVKPSLTELPPFFFFQTGHPASCRACPQTSALSARLHFAQTCLTRRRKRLLTGGLSEPIFRTATARSEPAAQPLEEKLERTGGRAPAHVWSRFGTDGWQMTSKARLWTWRAATATVFESSPCFYQDFMVHLGVFFFIYLFLIPATPGIRFGRASPRWRGNSRRSPLDVDIYGMCTFMRAWWYSTWQLLILAPLIPKKFLRNDAQKSPPGHELFICPHIY